MRIRRERTLWNMTQEELSSLLGITSNYLGQLERGTRDLSRKIEDRLCEVFNLTRADFVQFSDLTDLTAYVCEPDGIFRDLSEEDMMRLLKSCSKEELQFCGHILRSTLHYLRTVRKTYPQDRITAAPGQTD